MPGFESVGGGPQIDFQTVDSARIQQFWFALEVAVARTQDTTL
jgi:hypothetical protein